MEKYSTKENETYREHAEKAVHKVEEHGQKARHNLQENMQKLKDDADAGGEPDQGESMTRQSRQQKREVFGLPFFAAPA